jgi:prepilin-type processing-associated H-X9-DG protein
VELLIVVAIIAVLTGLILPVITQAREKGRQVSCTMNLRQLGMGIAMYRDDFDMRYPVTAIQKTYREDQREGFIEWARLVYPYLRHGATLLPDSPLERFSQGVFHCPNDPGVRGPSYAVNSRFLLAAEQGELLPGSAGTVLLAEKRGTIPQEQLVWWINPWPAQPLRLGTPIRGAEAAINSIDAATWGENGEEEIQDEMQNQERRESAGLQTLRHTGGANWLFADGHAKWARLTQIWGNATTTNGFWPHPQ